MSFIQTPAEHTNAEGRIKNVLNYKKPVFWVIAVTVLAVICLVAGLTVNRKEDNTIREGVYGLWESRTQYLGDNSAVGRIITELGFPEGLKYDGFGLDTSAPPYGITVNFKTDTETRNFYTGALNEVLFQRNAIIMFSLIENAEHIVFTLDDGQNPYSVDYPRAWAEDFMGGDLFAKTKTKQGFGELVEEISVKVNNIIEDATKQYQQWMGQENLSFFVKPDEPAEVIANTAAEVWLKSLMGNDVPAESRISDYKIVDVKVIAGTPRAGEKWEDMKYHYVVRVNYNITTAAEDYFAPGDGVSGKGSFEGLFRELCVKAVKTDGHYFEIVHLCTGGGEQIFAPPNYSQSLTAEELKQTEEIAKNYFTLEAPYYGGVISIYAAPDDFDLYRNSGIEDEYPPGNIVIYKVLTVTDKKDGNPERSISIARKAGDSDWKVINQGY